MWHTTVYIEREHPSSPPLMVVHNLQIKSLLLPIHVENERDVVNDGIFIQCRYWTRSSSFLPLFVSDHKSIYISSRRLPLFLAQLIAPVLLVAGRYDMNDVDRREGLYLSCVVIYFPLSLSLILFFFFPPGHPVRRRHRGFSLPHFYAVVHVDNGWAPIDFFLSNGNHSGREVLPFRVLVYRKRGGENPFSLTLGFIDSRRSATTETARIFFFSFSLFRSFSLFDFYSFLFLFPRRLTSSLTDIYSVDTVHKISCRLLSHSFFFFFVFFFLHLQLDR